MYEGEYDGYPYDEPYEPIEPYTAIEYPMSGETYPAPGDKPMYGVYRYSEYEQSSVLAGQVRRSFLNCFEKLEEAQENYPDAEWSGNGSGYVPPAVPDMPWPGFDPADAGESWDGD